jgi:predicted Ser/Thr protein kinase
MILDVNPKTSFYDINMLTLTEKGFWQNSPVQISILFFDLTKNFTPVPWTTVANSTQVVTQLPPELKNAVAMGNHNICMTTQVSFGGVAIPGDKCETAMVLTTNPNIWLFFGLGIAGGVVVIVVIIAVIFVVRRRRRPQVEYLQLPQEIEDFKPLMVKESEVKWGNLLGEGSFAIVYYGKWERKEVAIKEIKANPNSEKCTEFLQEVSTMKKIKHPHIVSMIGVIYNTKHFCILTEFMAKGSLSSILRNEDILVEEAHIKQMAIDTCLGLAYLHRMNIMHRDLKCANLLVDNNWTVKVGDFGLSRPIPEKEYTMTSCGTPAWAAPEVMQHRKYSTKADVFSFAICLWEMTTRQKPYAELEPYQIVIEVAVHNRRPELPNDILPQFADAIKACWKTDPEKRPSFTELVDYFESVKCPEPIHKTPYDYAEVTGGSLRDVV